MDVMIMFFRIWRVCPKINQSGTMPEVGYTIIRLFVWKIRKLFSLIACFSLDRYQVSIFIKIDSWFQAGFVLTTGINSAYVFGYSGAVMVPLGWVGGVVGLILATVISLYANALIAELLEFGRKRHIRYRELTGFVYGPKVYSLTWMLQYVNLFMINVGLIMLAGHALKAIYIIFRDDSVMKIPYFITIAGFSYGLFAICIPHMSALKIWLGFSTFFSLVYIIVAVALCLWDDI